MENTRRTRWAAIGAAVAVTIGSGGLMSASASVSSGERTVYVPITPCRVLDTRPAPDSVGTRSTPLTTQETMTTQMRGANGNCNVPSDAVGVVMNVVVVNPSGASYLTVYPADSQRPLAASVNWVAHQPPVSNSVTTDLAANGEVSFFNNFGDVDLSIDIVGYYADHNHDDRYYDKATVDAALAAEASARQAGLDGKVDVPLGPQIVHLDASSFSVDNSTVDYTRSNGDLRTLAGFVSAQAQVVIPDGATVTEVSAYVFDSSDPTDMTVGLQRNLHGPPGLSPMSSSSTFGSPGYTSLLATTITNPVIDNVNYTYVVRVGGIGTLTVLQDVTVTYTLP